MKIVTIVGARPQFIKAAVLSREIRKNPQIQEILIHTGQHYDTNMSDIFFQDLQIPLPNYNLGIAECSHGAMTGRMMEAIESVLIKEKPNYTLVYGDTNSTLAGALASTKLNIPVAHVEAGLRSFNRKMPEEINRILTDQCSDILFTPTQAAIFQLIAESIPMEKIHLVGDLMYDASLYYRQMSMEGSNILKNNNLKPKEYALSTIHRAENTNDETRLIEIFSGLNLIAKTLPVVIPIHPRTKNILNKLDLPKTFCKGLQLIDPVGYLDMVQLESNARAILTDSGGVQKEAYFFKVPCLTIRNETEWQELVDKKYNCLVKADRNQIEQDFFIITNNAIDWKEGLYGNGRAAEQIVSILKTCSKSF